MTRRGLVRFGIPIYVNADHRTIRLEISSTATVRWITQCALIALDIDIGVDAFELRHHGTALRAGKTAQQLAIDKGIVLELEHRRPRRRRRPWLIHTGRSAISG